ncbi:MAG: tryptophan synthase subunit beta [Planctomycetota bacterium]|jgi:tryptophan synthase beta chain|nr:tryptophan synthase subunit beta [Planctomycetota bacterium]
MPDPNPNRKSGDFTPADYFGSYGGRFVGEALRPALDTLERELVSAWKDPAFQADLRVARDTFIGRPTPLLYAENASKALGGARIYIKMEGLAHTGAHKINNAVGQALLARRMGKKRLIAETGAGQHGLATAAAAARFNLECLVYMGAVDMARQRPNVFAMETMGARVVRVDSGSRTLKDAVNAALRDWSATFPDTHYIIGSALGPSPFPDMVHRFQAVVGEETQEQLRQAGRDATTLIACVGGGSNAIGFFSPFLDLPSPRLVGVEAGGRGPGPGDNAVRMTGPSRMGVAHGYKSRFLMDSDGQIGVTHSISAGLDYPGVGPELASLGESGRIEFTSATDTEALEALRFFARQEGVLFALESAHAGAVAIRQAPGLSPDQTLVVNMSGRGDKDLFITAKQLDRESWLEFLRSEVENA